MNITYKWKIDRDNNGKFVYAFLTDTNDLPFIYKTDGTKFVNGVWYNYNFNELDITQKVMYFSEDEYSSHFEELKKIIQGYNEHYNINIILQDYSFYYNIENEGCSEDTPCLVCYNVTIYDEKEGSEDGYKILLHGINEDKIYESNDIAVKENFIYSNKDNNLILNDGKNTTITNLLVDNIFSKNQEQNVIFKTKTIFEEPIIVNGLNFSGETSDLTFSNVHFDKLEVTDNTNIYTQTGDTHNISLKKYIDSINYYGLLLNKDGATFGTLQKDDDGQYIGVRVSIPQNNNIYEYQNANILFNTINGTCSFDECNLVSLKNTTISNDGYLNFQNAFNIRCVTEDSTNYLLFENNTGETVFKIDNSGLTCNKKAVFSGATINDSFIVNCDSDFGNHQIRMHENNNNGIYTNTGITLLNSSIGGNRSEYTCTGLTFSDFTQSLSGISQYNATGLTLASNNINSTHDYSGLTFSDGTNSAELHSTGLTFTGQSRSVTIGNTGLTYYLLDSDEYVKINDDGIKLYGTTVHTDNFYQTHISPTEFKVNDMTTHKLWISRHEGRSAEQIGLQVDSNIECTGYTNNGVTHGGKITCRNLDVNSGIICTGATTASTDDGLIRCKTLQVLNSAYETSDARLKKFIEKNPDLSYDDLCKLNIYYYSLLSNQDKVKIGVSAQEIEKVWPEMVSTDDNGYKSVDYSRFGLLSLYMGQQMAKKIQSLEEELEKLKKKLV